MQYDVSHLLREPVGCQWDVEVDEVGTVAPVKGARIQGQLRLTRFNEGVWTEARLKAQAVQVCDRCLRSFHSPCWPISRSSAGREGRGLQAWNSGEPFVNGNGVLDLNETVRQHLILSLPTKLLCDPQCVGICPDCGIYGINHNHECSTREPEIAADPRWRELAALGSIGERG